MTIVPDQSPATAAPGGFPPALTADQVRAAHKANTSAATAKLHAVMAQKLSAVRLQAFEDASAKADNAHSWIVARYWYSVAYAESLYPALHYLEVGLRNAIYEAVATHLSPVNIGLPPCWLDWPEADTVLYRDAVRTSADDFLRVQSAKRAILQNSHQVDAGRLVAELSFGFWTGLFAGHYGARAGDDASRKFWPHLLPVVFPNLPTELRARTRLPEHLKAIRQLRNRAFHHEPLWRRKLKVDLELVMDTVSWLDPVLLSVADVTSRAKAIGQEGVGVQEKRVRDFALKLFPPASSMVGATGAIGGAVSG